jgi:hypothetical protein
MRICLRRREFIAGIRRQWGRRARACRISSEPLPALRVILAAEIRCGTPGRAITDAVRNASQGPTEH